MIKRGRSSEKLSCSYLWAMRPFRYQTPLVSGWNFFSFSSAGSRSNFSRGVPVIFWHFGEMQLRHIRMVNPHNTVRFCHFFLTTRIVQMILTSERLKLHRAMAFEVKIQFLKISHKNLKNQPNYHLRPEGDKKWPNYHLGA